MIVADSSLLIVLGRLNRLDILGSLFGRICIPTAVYTETTQQTKFQNQKEAIIAAIEADIIEVTEPTLSYSFSRRLDAGEIGVLTLALEKQANAIIMDDKKARNEAQALGFNLIYTTDVLKGAEHRQLIASYTNVISHLRTLNIFLPE